MPVIGSYGRWVDVVGRQNYAGYQSFGSYAGVIDVPWHEVYATATRAELNDPLGFLSVYNRWLDLNPRVDNYAKNYARNHLEKQWKKAAKLRSTTSMATVNEAAAAAASGGKKGGKKGGGGTSVAPEASDADLLAALLAPPPAPPMMAAGGSVEDTSSTTTWIAAGLGIAAIIGVIAYSQRK